MVPCPVFPPPPWDGGGMMPLWWCIYIHTYLHTYLPTYLRTYIHTYHYITLPYIPYIHTYIIHTYILTYIYRHTHIHTYIPAYIPTYQHTNIPTYHHHRPQGGGPTEPYHHHRPQGGWGTEEPYHHHRPQGGDQKNQTILSTHTHWWGGGGGWPTLQYIYIWMCLKMGGTHRCPFNYIIGENDEYGMQWDTHPQKLGCQHQADGLATTSIGNYDS